MNCFAAHFSLPPLRYNQCPTRISTHQTRVSEPAQIWLPCKCYIACQGDVASKDKHGFIHPEACTQLPLHGAVPGQTCIASSEGAANLSSSCRSIVAATPNA